LQTSLQEKIVLQNATGISHLSSRGAQAKPDAPAVLPWASGVKNNYFSYNYGNWGPRAEGILHGGEEKTGLRLVKLLSKFILSAIKQPKPYALIIKRSARLYAEPEKSVPL